MDSNQQKAAAAASSLASSSQAPPKKKNIVPPEVQRSIMEWLDEDLPNDSPARAARGHHHHHGRHNSPSPTHNNYIGARGRSASPRSRGTRRQKQVEKYHVFVDNPDLPPVHPANSIWLYASYEYKMQCPPEDAQRSVFRMVGKLVERMNRMLEASTAAMARGDVSKEAMEAAAQAAAIESMMPQPPSAAFAAEAAAGDKHKPAMPGLLAQSHPLQPAVAGGRFRAKGHLIFDIISTRKHIRKDFREGLPYKLGEEIYDHCQRKYTDCIATCFVGLTDNPASRVGRDIFYQKSDDLATSHGDFTSIDYSHLFVVFPPDNKRLQSSPNQDASSNSNDYDENNTRFLAEALSGAHDLTGSAIPGRPPPASSLRSSSKSHQQHLAQQQLASMLAQQQAAVASGADVTALNASIAAQLIAVHKQVFAAGSSSPRKEGAGAAVAAAAGGVARARNHAAAGSNNSPHRAASGSRSRGGGTPTKDWK